MNPIRIGLAACALIVAGCASTKAPAETAKPKFESSSATTVTGTVEAIDLPGRMVALRGSRGTTTFQIGQQVRNLPQIRVGDQVTVDHYESLAFEVKEGEGAAPAVQVAATLARNDPGEPPAGVAGTQTTVVAVVEAVDRESSIVTLRGPRGLGIVKVEDTAKLRNVQIGDRVVATYTEALAVRVEPQSPQD